MTDDRDVPTAVAPDILVTDRLILRRQRAGDADVFHRLWTERDERVPPHRRIDAGGHPTAEDIAAGIRAGHETAGLLTVVRKDTGDVIGYCGLVSHGNGAPDEPELAFELLSAVHNQGYATEAAGAVVAWASEAGCREPTKKAAINRAMIEFQRRLHLDRYFDAVRAGIVDDQGDENAMRGARR